MDYNSKEAKRKRFRFYAVLVCIIICVVLGFLSNIESFQIASYVFVSTFIWVASNFMWALGIGMAYPYASAYHWSNIGQIVLVFVEPILLVRFGIWLFG